MYFGNATDERKTDARTLSRSSDERFERPRYDLWVGIGGQVRERKPVTEKPNGHGRTRRSVNERVGNEVSQKGRHQTFIEPNGANGAVVENDAETFGSGGCGNRFRKDFRKVFVVLHKRTSRSRKQEQIVHRVAHRADFGYRGGNPFLGSRGVGKRQLKVAFRDGKGRLKLVGDMAGIGPFAIGELFYGANHLPRKRERYEKQQDRKRQYSKDERRKHGQSGTNEGVFGLVEHERPVLSDAGGIQYVSLSADDAFGDFTERKAVKDVGRNPFGFERSDDRNVSVGIRDGKIPEVLRQESAFPDSRFEIPAGSLGNDSREIASAHG